MTVKYVFDAMTVLNVNVYSAYFTSDALRYFIVRVNGIKF